MLVVFYLLNIDSMADGFIEVWRIEQRGGRERKDRRSCKEKRKI